MTRTTALRALLAALLFLVPAHALQAGEQSRPSKPSDFENWANRPKEPFTNGEQTLKEIKERLLKGYYRSDLTEEDLDRAAAQGMLHYADAKMAEWNKLISPAEYAELQGDLKGELVGVGLYVDYDEPTGMVVINGIMPHSPALKADLREGDKILTVDGASLKGKQLRDVIYAVRGKVGQPVTLGVLRDAQVLSKTLVRERIVLEPVTAVKLPDDILLLRIRGFVETTPAAVKNALTEAAKAKLRGLIVDLRDDSGGLLDSSVDTAKLLVPRGKTITTLSQRGGKEERFTSDADPILGNVPTAVLIDGDTKSSAELVAAALRENLSAPTIGTKTFGKWSAQSIDELPNKYVMKYTVGMFKTPSGQSYDGVGMPPDVEVAADPKELMRASHAKDVAERLASDPQLRAAHNLLRMRALK